jgi:LPPG:FO 2-phospho-L-lactate transferase
MTRVRVTVLAGGVGGSRFLRGVRAVVAPDGSGRSPVTGVVNTADDITLFGLRVCPDLDTIMYTLGGGNDEQRGWGRADETFSARDELVAYGAEPGWFGLGDRDLATHLVRTQALAAGRGLSDVTEQLCARWQLGINLLPMSDDPVETHIAIEDPPGTSRLIHFQEYWVRLHAQPPAQRIEVQGIDAARPAPGVVEAIRTADVLLLAPSNPVVSIGTILAVPGIRAAVADRAGPGVGVSPIIRGAPVRGMADKLLAAIAVATDAAAVGLHYGARRDGGLLDGWLVDSSDASAVPALESAGIAARARPLFMTDVEATAAIVDEALDLAQAVA